MKCKSKRSSLRRFLIIAFSFLMMILFNPRNTKSQIIYVDIEPDTTVATNYGCYNLDLNIDGINDFQIKLSALNNLPYIRIYPLDDNCYFAYFTVEGCIMAMRLELNDSINSTTPWFNYSGGGTLAMTGVNTCLHHGAFRGQIDKYLGLKVIKNGIIYFGWARIDVAFDVTWFTLKDYAYSTDVLTAGQIITGIPYNSASNPEMRVIENTSEIIFEPTLNETIVNGIMINTLSQSNMIPILDNKIRIQKSSYTPGLYILILKMTSGNYSRKFLIN